MMLSIPRFFFVGLSLLAFRLGSLNAQWIQTSGPGGGSINSLAISGTNLFAGTDDGVFLTTSSGASWTNVSNGFTCLIVYSLAISGTDVFAGTSTCGVFRSTNSGTTWTAVNNGLTLPIVRSLAVMDTTIFAGTIWGNVFRSTNRGSSWDSVNIGLINSPVWCLAARGTNLFAGTNGGVFLTTNSGSSWTSAGLSSSVVWALASNDANLFAGTQMAGAFLSTDNGQSWTAVNTGLSFSTVLSFNVSGNNVFAAAAAANDGGVFLTTNNGMNWNNVSNGLINPVVYALTASGNDLFAGTWVGLVWRRPLSEMITGIEHHQNEIPYGFMLSQNYPNPFNPSTTIPFDLPAKSFVSLKVFDALGREVETLVSEELATGTYVRQWSAAGLPSGIYFCRLAAGSFTETKKLILLR